MPLVSRLTYRPEVIGRAELFIGRGNASFPYGTFPHTLCNRDPALPNLESLLDDLEAPLARLSAADHGDPFAVLGPRAAGDAVLVVAYLPDARQVLLEGRHELTRWRESDVFGWVGPAADVPVPYRLSWIDGRGGNHDRHDPYSFPLALPDEPLARYCAGRGHDAWRWLGAHRCTLAGIEGIRFAVWAPDARRVSVVGDFNDWDGRRHPMRLRIGTGVWELFIAGIGNPLYKFELRSQDGAVVVKTDPFGRQFEHRPATAACVPPEADYAWGDGEWLGARAERAAPDRPLSIYEVHLGSWRRTPQGAFLNYRELAVELADHALALGFTHVELMPVMEHPLDESWGYQTTGYFAPTSRHGDVNDFRFLVDHLHQRGLGVLLDWVPGHFPRDAHGLARFDGKPLYEYADTRKGEHRDWGTLIFDYSRLEVRSFLLASACFWIEEFHADGLRVDAVASMIYLDYSRPAGEWLPNAHGGRENVEAISFLRELNDAVRARYPGVRTIAEESTDWAGVTAPSAWGGLGFDLKWNMGWMHDTLAYFREDPLFRPHHHNRLTFGITYAWSERFVLPFSHDEVVHLKRSLLGRMPGDDWQAHANLRLLLAWAWTFPGKKLLFMGAELAARGEWDSGTELPWSRLTEPAPRGVYHLIGDLNRLYRREPALHASDHDPAGFRWLDADDRNHSIYAYERSGAGRRVVIVLNGTPVPRPGYRVGLSSGGSWREVLNTDSAYYAGGNVGNAAHVAVEVVAAQGCEYSALVTVPPLAALVLACGE